jgi:beta-lactamase class A
MTRLLYLWLAATLLAPAALAQHHDAVLQAKLDSLVAHHDGPDQPFDGRAGFYVQHLRTGQTAGTLADTLFPTASVIKVPIVATIWDAIDQGEMDYTQTLVYRDSLAYPADPVSGPDLAGALLDSARVGLDKMMLLAITTSDNTASLWLQKLVGGERINAWLAEQGYRNTRVNSRTPGRRGDWERYGWGQTTPREMADLFVQIRNGEAVSPGASEEFYRMLTRIYWNDEALSALPPWVQAASKQGAVSRSRSEVLLVNAPHGDYVLSVFTSDQADTSWQGDNAGYRLLRDASALVWRYFEPGSDWTPPSGTRY